MDPPRSKRAELGKNGLRAQKKTKIESFTILIFKTSQSTITGVGLLLRGMLGGKPNFADSAEKLSFFVVLE